MRYFFVLFFALVASHQACAQRLPLWELGLATGYVSIPYYRGSASNRDVVLPMPLAVYRGKDLKVDEEGARRRLFSSKHLKLELSLAAGIPVPEGQTNKVRQGMPGLDATLEFGPRLVVDFWKKNNASFALHAPLRAVSSVSFSNIGLHGWVFAPYLYYMRKSPGVNGWEFDIALGPIYGSQKYHAYYYSVAPQYANAEREAYYAEAGYSGSRLTIYLQKSLNRLWLSAFARYDSLSKASFIDSPLVEKEHSLIAGFVIGWIFAKSPHRVKIPD